MLKLFRSLSFTHKLDLHSASTVTFRNMHRCNSETLMFLRMVCSYDNNDFLLSLS